MLLQQTCASLTPLRVHGGVESRTYSLLHKGVGFSIEPSKLTCLLSHEKNVVSFSLFCQIDQYLGALQRSLSTSHISTITGDNGRCIGYARSLKSSLIVSEVGVSSLLGEFCSCRLRVLEVVPRPPYGSLRHAFSCFPYVSSNPRITILRGIILALSSCRRVVANTKPVQCLGTVWATQGKTRSIHIQAVRAERRSLCSTISKKYTCEDGPSQ